MNRTALLPYYALSNLLTLFAHDMPSLALIQHVFDWLLCRPPVSVVYLACAVGLFLSFFFVCFALYQRLLYSPSINTDTPTALFL
jgi:hypothetical protein